VWPKGESSHGGSARISPMLGPGLVGLSAGMTF
jgi:hypothetical protein